ncbi:telomeric repeat binding factor a [Antennarius striatus]|uniref:telomeric repeat binding factor a n=1 Tax=Antennarius striatus TaxID=241820 RepID=UPI0035B196E3
MAAKEVVSSSLTGVEPVINRWLLDHYYSLALDFFQNEQYNDFLGIRNILNGVLERPLELTESTQIKIRVLQFLSRINDGENLDASFESDQISPLESALILLGNINKEFSIPPQDFENVCISLKDMMVSVLIKNGEFDMAEKVLKQYFPKPMVGKKAIFMGLIKKKTGTHKVIEQFDFRKFKEEMLIFCKSLCPLNVPFLQKVARMCINKRCEEVDDKTTCEEQDEPEPHSAPQKSTDAKFLRRRLFSGIITKSKLEAAYMALVVGSRKTFNQLNNEVEKEQQAKEDLCLRLSPSPTMATSQDSEQSGSFQRAGSPMEASPADQPPQKDDDPQIQAGSLSKTTSVPRKRRLYTLARLVVDPDSQVSLHCTTPAGDLESEVRSEDPPETATRVREKDLQNPVTEIEVSIPKRKHPRKARTISSSEEDTPSSAADWQSCVEELHNQSNSSFKRNSRSEQSSDSEEDPRSPARCRSSVQKPQKSLASHSLSKQMVPEHADEVYISDSSLDTSPNLFPADPVPRKSSTPQKHSTQDPGPSNSKWKQLMSNALETKDTWSDEESNFTARQRSLDDSLVSNSGHRKRKWTEDETKKLKEGVRKFGEGNWNKIAAYYSFKDRTNVQIKDRWRTMKKLNMI